MCARRFLLLMFFLTMLTVAGAFALFQFGGSVLKRQTIPTGRFVPSAQANGPDYIQTDNWIALPDTVPPSPAEWRPDGLVEQPTESQSPRAATFFLHPTTYLKRDRWNAPVGDRESQDRARLFVRSQASAFNAISAVYAPKYRQAAFGAFLDDSADARAALDLAYRDIDRAFTRFLAQVPDGPLILAGHSQGALHLARLLRERVASDPALARRIVAAYVVGWPISTAADVPRMGLPACTRARQANCILSWQSFAEPANTDLVTDAYEGTAGFTGAKRRREDMLCVNPLSGITGGAMAARTNPGTLVPTNLSMSNATSTPGLVGARCERGFLLIDGELPDLGPFVLPGNNYHVYDYALFWAAIRSDAARRLEAWREQ